MAEYLPWSLANLDKVLESFHVGGMPILDLELSAFCQHRVSCGGCIYCDSPTGLPHEHELSLSELTSTILSAKQNLGLQWIYSCGLGEPSDDPQFIPLVEFASSHDISFSIFTNGINYTKDYLKFLYANNVSMLVKCDSFDPNVFGQLLGTDDLQIIKSIYKTINMALEVGFGDVDDNGCSRLALSIVPTSRNKSDLIEVVRFCKDSHVFPLLGQLEYAGQAKDIFEELALSSDELLNIKLQVETILEVPYEIPVCPAGIAGAHITNTGECVVHQDTGLSCPWFDLTDPTVTTFGNVRQKDIDELWNDIQAYRSERLENIQVAVKNYDQKDVFGGCGGHKLLETYMKTM